MSSKYTAKEPINTSSTNKVLKTRKEIEDYVKRVNPYKRGRTSIQGVVQEVTNYFMLERARDINNEVRTNDIDDYFRRTIPFAYQMSGEYITDIVHNYQDEKKMKQTKVSDEMLTYIRNELRYRRAMNEEMSRQEVQYTLFEAYDKKGNIKKGLDVRVKDNGAVVADVYAKPERYGGYISLLYEQGTKMTPKAQLTESNVKQQYEKMGIEATDEEVKGVIDQIKREMFLEQGQSKTSDTNKYSFRQYNRGIIDLSGVIKQTIYNRRAKLDEDILEQIGKFKDMGEVIDDFDNYMEDFFAPQDVLSDGEIQILEDMKHDFSVFIDEIHNGLIDHTTERLIPLIYNALKLGMSVMTQRELNQVLTEVYDSGQNPDNIYMFYQPEVLSEWIHKILPEFNVPSAMVNMLSSECFNETRADVYERVRKRGYGATTKKTKGYGKTASKVRNKRKK